MARLKPLSLPEQAELFRLLDVDFDAGILFWKPRGDQTWSQRSFNTRNAGKPALQTKTKNGYLHGRLDGRYVYAHRVIWKMFCGDDANQVDHINGDRSDNRIVNLRSLTIAENGRNLKVSDRNSSGVIGVCFDNTRKSWIATIMKDGKDHRLGRFEDFEKAVAARKAAEVRLSYHP